MYISVEDRIRERIMQMKRGEVFFPENFFDLGSETACRKALERMSGKGEIMFVARGIYAFPEKSELFGDVPPSMDQIAMAIAQRDHARIIPTGQYAAHVLGFTTQIPLQVTYLTDGIPRKISIGKRSLRFNKTAPKNLSAKGENTALIIQGLKAVGKDGVTEEMKAKVKGLLGKENPSDAIHDMMLAPEWIRNIMKEAL